MSEAAPVRVAPSLRYHRLLRALAGYRWWKPLVALLIAAVLWIVFSVIITLIGTVIAVARGSIDLTSVQAATDDLLALFGSVDAADPLSLLVALLSVVTLLPSVLLAYRIVGLRPGSVLRSVQFRFRWTWLWLCLAAASIVTLVASVVEYGLFPLFFGGDAMVAPTVPLPQFLICALIIVVVTPVQAAAEEFAYRGLATQMFGAWIRFAPIPIVLSGILFAISHTQYVGWATADVAVFALVAGFVTWRTGGLEAGIALHAANNTIAFLALAPGILGTTKSASGGGDPWSLLVSILTMGAYAFWVDRWARRRRLRALLDPDPVPAANPVGTLAGIPDTSTGYTGV